MVSVKNGDAHNASLRNDRWIYTDTRLIRDQTEHPAFLNAVRFATQLYGYPATTEYLDRMTFVSTRHRTF